MKTSDFVTLTQKEILKITPNFVVDDINVSGNLTKFFLHFSDTKILNQYLYQNPSLINDTFNNIPLVEHLIKKGFGSILKNYAHHIDLTLADSKQGTITTCLINQGMMNILQEILYHSPDSINIAGENGIYPVELMAKNGYTATIKHYSSYINLNLPASDGYSICTYLIKKGLIDALGQILYDQPTSINCPDFNGIYPVELLAKEGYTNILKNYANYIDLTLPNSKNGNIATSLIEHGLINSLQQILYYSPNSINIAGKNGIYPVELMANNGYTNIIKNYAAYIDLNLPASDGYNLCTYLIRKGQINSLSNILDHQPSFINLVDNKNQHPADLLAKSGYTHILKRYESYINRNIAKLIQSSNFSIKEKSKKIEQKFNEKLENTIEDPTVEPEEEKIETLTFKQQLKRKIKAAL